MKLKNNDPGKIWAKSDHWLKSYGHFCHPFQGILGFLGFAKFGPKVRRTSNPKFLAELSNPNPNLKTTTRRVPECTFVISTLMQNLGPPY